MKALVLLSGGVDSSTCLALAKEKYGDQVMALSISYGQKHSRELKSARTVAAYYNVELLEMDLAAIFSHSNCSLLQNSMEEIPKESYADQLAGRPGGVVSTYVPFRNGLFMSTAASIALAYGCEVIYYGPHADDAAGNAYPDCSEEFNAAMSQAIYLGSGQQLRVEAPFVNMHKADIVATGLRLGVPYELTWSCYCGEAEPCGQCGTCRDRKMAFEANGVKDPLLCGRGTEFLTK